MEAPISSSLGAMNPLTRKRTRREIMVAPMSSSLGAMGPLLRKLDRLLAPDCSKLPKQLKNRIKSLKRDLLEDIITPFVELSKVQAPNLLAKYWMTEVRELSYDLEDSIDEMTPPTPVCIGGEARTVVVRCHRVGHAKIARLLPKKLKRRTRIAKVAQLRTTLVWEAIERHERYLQEVPPSCSASAMFGATGSASGRSVPRLKIARLPRAPKWHTKVDEIASPKTPSQETTIQGNERYQQRDGRSPSFSHLFVTTQRVFGIDDSRIRLTKWLKDEAKQSLEVVSIVGSGGIGKSTLIKELYRELGGQFECRAFVRASRKPNMRRLLWGILAQIQPLQRPSCASTVQSLIDDISIHLQDKRYLIVIDDLWQTTVWDIVVSAFPERYKCSRIITTTEMEDVALECCSYQSDHIFKMSPLGNDDSSKLFLNIVFGSEHRSHKQLEEVSYELTRKFGGLPLTTVSAASLVRVLASQPKKSEAWSHIQDFLSSTLTSNPSSEGIMKEILNLSYNCLPLDLKTCLLFLSIYPEGYTIWKADLVKQWIAEGFIVTTQGKDKKEVAESYFNELINRRMIHPNHINHIDGVLSCTVHHIVLGIIKCQSREENFTTVIDYPQIITGLSTKVRRLSLQLSSAKHATKQAGAAKSQVRSLAFFGLHECMPPIEAFKLLRVLILEIWGDHDGCTSFDLTRICSLIHLRYLKITCDVTVELPHEMLGLQHLETLEVDATVSAVPLDIIHLPRLSQLRVRDEKNLPDGIGSIRSLHTLQYFDLAKNSEKNVRSLGQLTNLRDLHLTCSIAPSDEHLQRNLEALASSLWKLGTLSSLALAPGASGVGRIYLEGPSVLSSPPVLVQRLELLPPLCIFSRLPKWIGQLRMLRVLKIVVRELLRDDMDSLGELPALTVLSLHIRVARVGTVIIKPASFPALSYFRFRCGVLCMAFRAGAMPNLRRLKLGFSAQRGKQYGRMLAGVEHLPNLQEITGQIAAAAGAGESDRRAAESAFHNTIEVSRQKWDAKSEHPWFPRVHVKWADWAALDKAYAYHQEEGSAGGARVTTMNRDGGCNMLCFPVELLPDVIALTSPIDAGRCSTVCTAFQAAATCDEVWGRFFPPDYLSILSRAIDPVDFGFASTKKELFISLAEQPILIDQGNTSFWLERTSGAKCYMLASRSLHIVWGEAPQYWRWISLSDSRFEEVAELIDVCWLDIIATIDCRELTPNTRYAAYLVFNLTDRFYGLDCPTQEACITMATGVSAGYIVCLHPRSPSGRRDRHRGRGDPQDSQERRRGEEAVRYPRARGDGWMEVEMGEFYNGNLDDGAVEIRLKEHTTLGWKRGLIVEGVEIRPRVVHGKK